MNSIKTKEFLTIFSATITGILIGSLYILVSKIDIPKSETVIFAAICGLILIFIYFIYIIKKPTATLPLIFCFSWFVYYEPALSDVLSWIAIIALLINILITKKIQIKLSFTEIMLLTFIILNITNVIYSVDFIYSVKHFSISLYLIMIFLLISFLSDEYSKILTSLNFLLIPCILTSGIMILIFLTENLGINIGVLKDIVTEGGRQKAFFKDSNVAGASLIMPATYTLVSLLNQQSKFNSLLLIVFIASGVGVFLALSRASILAFLFSVSLALWFSLSRSNLIKLFFLIITVFIAVTFLVWMFPRPKYLERVIDPNFGVQNRIERVQRGIEQIKKSPLFGSGMELIERKAPHDTYFLIITQTGIVGFLLLWLPLGYLIGKLLLNYKKLETSNEKIIALTLGISLSSYLLFGVVIYFLHWRHFWYTTGLAAATVNLINKKTKQQYW